MTSHHLFFYFIYFILFIWFDAVTAYKHIDQTDHWLCRLGGLESQYRM